MIKRGSPRPSASSADQKKQFFASLSGLSWINKKMFPRPFVDRRRILTIVMPLYRLGDSFHYTP